MKKTTETAETITHELITAGLVSATLTAPRHKEGEASEQHAETADKIKIHRIQLDNGRDFQIEEFRGPKAFQKNVSTKELKSELSRLIGTVFSRAEFTTNEGSLSVMANRRGELSAIRKKSGAGQSDSQTITHNRVKQYILSEGDPVPFLVDLGVMTAEGKVIQSRYDKFRQINRFLEFIADVVPDLEKSAKEKKDKNPQGEEITIVDFGCGKSYLTFAVYHYLVTMRKLKARIIGLDLKKDVIERCDGLAKRYGYDRLSFSVGNIADYTGTNSADMVITLHACDTATDFAIAQAVRWNSRVILSVPCCQHELNAQLDNSAGAAQKDTGRRILAPALKYGIIKERMAALFTDAMRAELLESEGYRVQILEFIDMSHTPKNLLIRAVRSTGADSRSSKDARIKSLSEYETLKDFLGVKPTLERELGER